MVKTRSLGSLIFDVFIYSALIFLVAIIIYPLYYMLIISISDGIFVQRGDVSLIPKGINIDAYKIILDDPNILRSYANTLFYASFGTMINLGMTALCAYPLARKKLYGRAVITVFIIFTMFFNGGMIPKYLVLNNLGMLNTIWAIVIPPAINVWYMIIMRTFFQNIPEEIHESAHMDGANDLTTFARIVLPLSIPVMATMTMFYAVWHWNSFFPALIFLDDKELFPIQIMMRNIVIEGTMTTQAEAMGGSDANFLITATNIKYAVIIITILPILLVYPFIQKYFVKGVMIGSLKG